MTESDWRDGLDELDGRLLDDYQRGFPVRERPFDALGADLGVNGETVLERLRALSDRDLIRRVGPVLAPDVVGASTLAAISVPDDEFAQAAATVNGYRGISHNYRRGHEWNMWFVLTAYSRDRLDEILAEIAAETGCDPLVVPKLATYGIDLEFAVTTDDRTPGETTKRAAERVEHRQPTDATRDATPGSGPEPAPLSELEARILLEVQDGLALTPTPYRDVARTLDVRVDEVTATIERLRDRGCLKRVGCVVGHSQAGYDANSMVVWDVPTSAIDAVGTRVGTLPFVTKCYRRPRRPERNWPYTLFTMIHGRDAHVVEERIDELATEHLPYPHERLETTERLKQTGVRFERLGPIERPPGE